MDASIGNLFQIHFVLLQQDEQRLLAATKVIIEWGFCKFALNYLKAIQ